MSGLSIAVAMHKGYAEITKDMEGFNTLQFEDLTNYPWALCRDSLYYGDTVEEVESQEGSCYSLDVYRGGPVTEDEKYVMFDVDNGCGDRYFVVLSKEDRIQEED